MKPIIAITGNYAEGKCTMLEGYYQSVLAAGGIPIIVPPFSEEKALDDMLERVDGIIFSGGGDIASFLLGEEPLPEVGEPNIPRDEQEWPLMQKAVRKQMPVLGICRGVQMMTAALGGKLWQDIYVQAKARIPHSQETERYMTSHSVSILPGTLLSRIMGHTEGFMLPVNSFHHQSVREAAPGFRISALSTDNIPEAVESIEGKPLLGVQWHPECMILGGDESMLPLFRWLMDEASKFARTRRFHRHHLTLDTH